MSTNCIRCGLKDGRTGHDVLCDECRDAAQTTAPVSLKTLRQSLEHIVREAEQVCVDVQSWNDNRPDSPPLDCEFERLLVFAGRRAIAAAARGDVPGFESLAREVIAIAVDEAEPEM